MWYVIQVLSGREELIRTWIGNLVSDDVYEDCRIVLYESQKRYEGEWHTEYRKLFPGYIFILSSDASALKQELKKIPEFTSLLGYDSDIIPLSQKEVQFLRHLTGGGECVSGSIGIQIGDRVIVQSGPLKGYETVIRKINRHKRKAQVDLTLLGHTRLIELGLEIVEKVKVDTQTMLHWKRNKEN